jgi:two-component system LytT family response regulator
MNNGIKAIIIEDSKGNREALKSLLKSECPEVTIIGEASDIDAGYELIKDTEPDLVFLDIQLKDQTSFDLLDRLVKEDSINFEIIFTTAYGNFEYATRAIAYSALDFITKPIDSQKLKQAVEKAKSRISKEQYRNQIKLLLENISSPQSNANRIAIHLTKGVIEFVPVDDIRYLEADRTITYVYLKEGEKLNAMRNLGHYSKLLVGEHPFHHISNKFVVNLDYVKRYTHSNLTVELEDGTELNASRRGGQDFRRFLNNQDGMKNKLDVNWWRKIFGT